MLNEEAIIEHLLKGMTIPPIFRLHVSVEDVELMMTAAYKAEVIKRRRQPIIDDGTKSNLRAISAALTSKRPPGGLILMGPCGNGKTTALNALEHVIRLCLYEELCGDGINTCMRIIDARELNGIAKEPESFTRLKNRQLLGIEDIGREPTEVLDYGNVMCPLIELIEYRYENQLFTVITTNLSPQQIREKYGDRIADRFREMMLKIYFKQESYRK